MSNKIYLLFFTSVLGFALLNYSCEAADYPPSVHKVTVLPTQKSSLGEGPFFDPLRNLLYYVDSFNGDFVRLNLANDSETKVHVGGTVTIIIPYDDGSSNNNFIVTKDSQLLKLNWATGATEVLAEVHSDLGNEKFNDGKCDAYGRLIVGTTTTNAIGGIVPNASAVYRLEGNRTVKLVEGISVSNGMSWSNDPEHRTFYLNDFGKRIVYRFDYDLAEGTLSNQTELIVMKDHPDFVANEYPDGMVMDKFGFIWIALYSGGRIVKINPDTGRVVDEIKFPRANSPTSLAFGDYKGEDGFFVTTGLNLLDGGKIHHVSFQGGEILPFNPAS